MSQTDFSEATKTHCRERGEKEAREIHAESPAKAADLLRQWEAILPGMGVGMDRLKIEAAVAELRKLLGH